VPDIPITLDQLLYGIRMVETSGRADGYSTVNSIGAVGAYQVLKSNIPSWTREALGKSLTWQQFRDSPSAQDAVARYKLGGYLKKYGAAGAAAVWFSGSPNVNSSASDGGNTVRQYVAKVLKWATGADASSSSSTSTSPAPSSMPSLKSAATAQQAGYQAGVDVSAYGMPVNPFKVPGWIASASSAGGAGSTGDAAQAGLTDTLTGGITSIPWDGVATVILSSLFVLGGLALVVVGFTSAISPAVNAVGEAALSATPEGAAAGALKGGTS
jgi:hypothetical protein